jgi:hypothetical protein
MMPKSKIVSKVIESPLDGDNGDDNDDDDDDCCPYQCTVTASRTPSSHSVLMNLMNDITIPGINIIVSRDTRIRVSPGTLLDERIRTIADTPIAPIQSGSKIDNTEQPNVRANMMLISKNTACKIGSMNIVVSNDTWVHMPLGTKLAVPDKCDLEVRLSNGTWFPCQLVGQRLFTVVPPRTT